MQTSHDAEEPATMPYDLPLLRVQSLGSVEGNLTLNELMVLCTKLSKRVEDLQSDLQQTKLTYGAAYTKLILRVKKLEHKVKTSQHKRRERVIDKNPSISLVQDEGTSWIQEDYEIQGRTSADTKILLDQKEPTELVEDLGSGEKGENKLVLSFLKDAKIAKQLQEAIAEAALAHDIDWNDPAVLRYHALQNRSFFVAKEVMKKSRFDLQQKQFAKEVSEKKDDSSSKPVRGSRKKTIAVKRIGAKLDEESDKRQKLKDVTKEATTEYEKEKEELRTDGSSSYHGNVQAFLRRIDKKDLNDLYSLVQERFQDHPLEGHDLLLWGDLRMIFVPDENDKQWMNQLD
uniref:Uncharacterized protein n=1 Tax=Tanacetum cinerariifolium TaxID=118510 RepID=A0A699GYE3_TANCI|nr:hypothetical protein [Tanacetum cinerariifolium]